MNDSKTRPTSLSSQQIIKSLLSLLSSSGSSHTQRAGQSSSTPQVHGLASYRQQSPSVLCDQQWDVRVVLLTLHFIFPHELLPALDLLDRQLLNLFTTNRLASTTPDESTSSPTPPINRAHPLQDEEKVADNSKIKQALQTTQEPLTEVYYVQSASAQSDSRDSRSQLKQRESRFRNAFNPRNIYYETRLDSWNCSCPAFAYSAYTLLLDFDDDQPNNGTDSNLKKLVRPNFSSFTTTEQMAEAVSRFNSEATPNTAETHFGGTLTNEQAPTPICKHVLAVALSRAAPALFGHAANVSEIGLDEVAGWAAGWGDHG